jgi:hypothetical protein
LAGDVRAQAYAQAFVALAVLAGRWQCLYHPELSRPATD